MTTQDAASLEAQVPSHEPAADMFQTTGLAALGAVVPIAGSLAATVIQGGLASRQAARQHDFNLAVARQVDELVEGTIPPEDILESEEFLAAYARTARAADETANATKRVRLASALAHCGPWNDDFAPRLRAQFLDLVIELDELDLFLLHYFRSPATWLAENSQSDAYKQILMGGISNVLGDHVFVGVAPARWRPSVDISLSRLETAQLASVPMDTVMTGSGTIISRITQRGEQFLRFLAEGPSENEAVPTLV